MKRGMSIDLSRKSTGVVWWQGITPVATEIVTLPEGELGNQLSVWEAHLMQLVPNPPIPGRELDWVAFEDARAVSKQHGMILFGMTGALLRACWEARVQTVGFAQATVKKALTNSGRATKDDMMEAAKLRYPTLPILADDVADAVGVGLAFINLVGEEQLL